MAKKTDSLSEHVGGKDVDMRKLLRYSFILLTFLVWQPLVLLGIFWQVIPAEIPTSFDILGHITGYGDKSALLVLAAISAFIYIEHLVLSNTLPKKTSEKSFLPLKLHAVSNPADVSRARSIILRALTAVNAIVVIMLDYVMGMSATGREPLYAIPAAAILILIVYFWYERRMRAVKIELEERVAHLRDNPKSKKKK